MQGDKAHQQKMTRKQREEHMRNMELPINKFLNAKDEQGNPKFPVAKIIADWDISNPDPAMNAIAIAEGFLHTLQWRKNQAQKYFAAHHATEQTTMRGKDGELMSKDDCYLAYVSMMVNIKTGLADLRSHIINKVLPTCDGEIFTFQQFNDLVLLWEKKVKEMGYELFPTRVQADSPQQ